MLADSVPHAYDFGGILFDVAVWHALTPAQQRRTNLHLHVPHKGPVVVRSGHHPSWLLGCSGKSLRFLIEAAVATPRMATLFSPILASTTCPLCSTTPPEWPRDMWTHLLRACAPVTQLAEVAGLAWVLRVAHATTLGGTMYCAAGPLTDLMRIVLRRVGQVVPVGGTAPVELTPPGG